MIADSPQSASFVLLLTYTDQPISGYLSTGWAAPANDGGHGRKLKANLVHVQTAQEAAFATTTSANPRIVAHRVPPASPAPLRGSTGFMDIRKDASGPGPSGPANRADATKDMTRCTLLLITSGESGRKALSEGMLLAERYVEALPLDLTIVESTPFALAPAKRIQERVSFPVALEDTTAAATAVGQLQAIWNGRRWLTPGSCPAKPPEDNGATEWQWAHYHAVLEAPDDSIMLLWDIYVVPVIEHMAA